MKITQLFLIVSLFSTAACSSDESDLDNVIDAGESSSSGEGDEAKTDEPEADEPEADEPEADEPETMDMPNFLGCNDEEDLETQGSFAGPLFDSETNTIVGEAQPSYVAATTIFNFRDDVRAEFERVVDNVIAQSLASPGFVGYELAYSETCRYGRTITVWEDESAMMDFALSGAHANAMTRVRELGNDGRTIDWEVRPADLPISWATAREQLTPVLP